MTTINERTETDQARFEAFGDRMVGMLNAGCTALLTSIGHQTGLFDTLAAAGAVTSEELAERAALNERYVREWLGGLTVAGVVEYHPTVRTYSLPREHAGWLTTEAGPNNLARAMQFIPLLAQVEQGIVQCFRDGGGLSYAHYPSFHALMDEDSRAFVDAALVGRWCRSPTDSTGDFGPGSTWPTSAAAVGTRSTSWPGSIPPVGSWASTSPRRRSGGRTPRRGA